MSEKHKPTSPSVIGVKIQEKIKKLYICCNVRLTHSSVPTIRDHADRIKESVKSGTKVFVLQDYQSYWN
jgi:hypothetical protein